MKDPFAFEAKYYDKIWGVHTDYEEEARFLHNTFKTSKVKRVLDAACGTGSHIVELAKLGYDVVGIDISEAMVKLARKKMKASGVKAKIVTGDILEMISVLKRENLRAKFDAVTCLGRSLAHMTDEASLKKVLQGTSKALRRGGVFVFSVGNVKALGGDPLGRPFVDLSVDEQDLSIVLVSRITRENSDPTLVRWDAYYFIADHGKFSHQAKTHLLRWFERKTLEKLLEANKFRVTAAYGELRGDAEFNESTHSSIFMVCRKR